MKNPYLKYLKHASRTGVAALVLLGFLMAPLPSAAQGTDSGSPTYGPVKSTDTLWGIAKQQKLKEIGASVAQMAWAIYRANPDKFEGSVHRIKSGAILTIPSRDDVQETSAEMAERYVLGEGPQAQPMAQVNQAAAPAPAEPSISGTTGSSVVAAVAPATEPTPAPEPPALPPPSSTADAEAAAAATKNTREKFKNSQPGREILGGLRTRPAGETYRMLVPLESEFSGDSDYDYAYGVAALDSEHNSEAVFALQRVVASSPGFSGARLDLGRAYYAVGDNEAARGEFLVIQNDAPPPHVQKVIEQYLDAIDRRAALYQRQIGGFAELAIGYDSNANGSTDSQSFLGFDLNERNQAQESEFVGLTGGAHYSQPLAPRWRMLFDGQLGHRSFPSASFVDSTQARAGAGLAWQNSSWTLNGVLSGAYSELDGERNNFLTAVDFSALRTLSADWQYAATLRYAALRYASALSVQDVDTVMAGLTLTRTWMALPRLQASLALAAGQDEAVESGSPFGRDLWGVRTSLAVQLADTRQLFFSAAGLTSDYDGMFFGSSREDRQYSAVAGFDWQNVPARFWGFRTQFTYVDNQSDVVLFDYDRWEISMLVRREFR